jgi:hypothetical protein
MFEAHRDVGAPAIAGSAAYEPATGEYILTAAGVNMWGERDEFQFVWTKLLGDFALEAQVEFVGSGVEPHRKAGCIIRHSLDPDAPYVDAAVHGDGLTALQYRRTAGGISDHVVSPVKGANAIRLERRGSEYRFLASRNGDPVESCELSGVSLGDDVYVGLFLCSHNAAVVERAIFRAVRFQSLSPTPARLPAGSTGPE